MVNVEVEAGPPPAKVLGKAPVAVWKLEDLPGRVHGLPNGPEAQVGTHIFGPVFLFLQHRCNPGPAAAADADVAVALVVFEQNIILWLVLLNQAALQHKGLKLAVSQDVLEPVHIGDHFAHFGVVVFFRAKVLAHPVFQGLGLADVDDLSGLVVH